ncbi:cupin domain-containing protein [Streptomyces sp.]|uniref:cupin domain-containing protein n=1 Tax=Streptomyces sp. TaxID=1931 RepID=UPI002F956D90
MSDSTDSTSLTTVVNVNDLEYRQVAPGIMRRQLPVTEYAGGWLIDFAPGTQWPAVDEHSGEERYYVISGEVIEGEERHGPGTYVVFAPGSSHRPRTEIGAQMIGLSILSD